jgi:hypothetical protein
MKKTFRERIAGFTAAQISDATGCPKATAYDWLKGRRSPPAWQQDDIARKITRSQKTTA